MSLPVSAETTNRLTLTEDKEVINWYSKQGEEKSIFMNFVNMVPGVRYEDSMVIENDSKKTYEVFMQVINPQQESMLNELLELISMKVYYNDDLLYSGTAIGKSYEGSVNNLQNVIPLGSYKAGKEGSIKVEVELLEDVGIEHSDLLSKIDWKFMVNEKDDGGGKVTPPKPGGTSSGSGGKTGDMNRPEIFAIIGIISIVAAIVISNKRKYYKAR